MTIRHDVALALLGVGAAVVLLGCFALIALPGPFVRLHATAVASSLGLPLVTLALAVDTGPGRGAVKLLVIGALVALSGPVTTMAVGKALHEQRHARRSTASRTAHRPAGSGARQRAAGGGDP